MDVLYRKAYPEDCRRLAELDVMAADGAADFLFHGLGDNQSTADLIADSFEKDANPQSYSWQNAIVAEVNGNVIAMALAFPARYHGIGEQERAYFPAERLAHFEDFFSARVDNSFFLDGLAVEPEFRRRGIASHLLELVREKAKQQGFEQLSLLVFADNATARRLYGKNQFSIVRQVELAAHPLMPHEGGCLLMKASL